MWEAEGTVIRGAGRGNLELNCPTANLDCVLSKHFQLGVYYGTCTLTGKKYRCVMNVGIAPYFEEEEEEEKTPCIEVHILDYQFQSVTFYGERLFVNALGYLRPERSDFNSVDELRACIKQDIRRARVLMRPPVSVIALSGIIGVGKSTLVNRLRDTNAIQERNVHVCYMLEPTDVWAEHKWLERFYENPDKRALSFQMLAFDSHVNCMQKTLECAYRDAPVDTRAIVCIVERSMWDQMLFWKVQCKLNRKTAESMDDEAYIRIWEKWNSFLPPVKLIFYCQTHNVQECMRRVLKRSRGAESGLSEDYQNALLSEHVDWFYHNKRPCADLNWVPLCLDSPYHTHDDALKNIATYMMQQIKLNNIF